MLLSIMLDFGAVNALVPILIILVLIAAAAGAMRNYDIFGVLGFSTLLGLGGGAKKGSFSGKSGFAKGTYKRGTPSTIQGGKTIKGIHKAVGNKLKQRAAMASEMKYNVGLGKSNTTDIEKASVYQASLRPPPTQSKYRMVRMATNAVRTVSKYGSSRPVRLFGTYAKRAVSIGGATFTAGTGAGLYNLAKGTKSRIQEKNKKFSDYNQHHPIIAAKIAVQQEIAKLQPRLNKAQADVNAARAKLNSTTPGTKQWKAANDELKTAESNLRTVKRISDIQQAQLNRINRGIDRYNDLFNKVNSGQMNVDSKEFKAEAGDIAREWRGITSHSVVAGRLAKATGQLVRGNRSGAAQSFNEARKEWEHAPHASTTTARLTLGIAAHEIQKRRGKTNVGTSEWVRESIISDTAKSFNYNRHTLHRSTKEQEKEAAKGKGVKRELQDLIDPTVDH